MDRALQLARLGRGWVNPNPMVGCVIASDGQIIGEGFHERFGELHAERNALADCYSRNFNPKGATAYVTLEPCAHTGKTPPCTEALIESGISKVVIGSNDPNDLVAGKGICKLRSAGIEVVTGVLEDECDRLNRPFFHWIKTKKPLVIAKYAMTLDGKCATFAGSSKWITGEKARQRVHDDRATFSAVAVGVGTVISDDPMLTARIESEPHRAHQPLRVIFDSNLRTPMESNVVRTAEEVKTLLVTCVENQDAHHEYEKRGCSVLFIPKGADGKVNLASAISALGSMGYDSLIVEGGPALLGSFFDARLVDEVQAYIAPRVIGGASAPGPVGGAGVEFANDAINILEGRITQLGDDILYEGKVSA